MKTQLNTYPLVLGTFSGGQNDESREIFLRNVRQILDRIMKIIPSLTTVQDFLKEFPNTEHVDEYTQSFERNFQYISDSVLGAVRAEREEVINLFSFQTKVNRYCSLILTQKGDLYFVESHFTHIDSSTRFRWSKILSPLSSISYIPPSSDLAQFSQLFYDGDIYTEKAVLKSADFIKDFFRARFEEIKKTRQPMKKK